MSDFNFFEEYINIISVADKDYEENTSMIKSNMYSFLTVSLLKTFELVIEANNSLVDNAVDNKEKLEKLLQVRKEFVRLDPFLMLIYKLNYNWKVLDEMKNFVNRFDKLLEELSAAVNASTSTDTSTNTDANN